MSEGFLYLPGKEFGESPGRERLITGEAAGAGVEYVSVTYGFFKWGSSGLSSVPSDYSGLCSRYRKLRALWRITSSGVTWEVLYSAPDNPWDVAGFKRELTAGSLATANSSQPGTGLIGPYTYAADGLSFTAPWSGSFGLAGTVSGVLEDSTPQTYQEVETIAYNRLLAAENPVFPFDDYKDLAYIPADTGYRYQQNPGIRYVQTSATTEIRQSGRAAYSNLIRGPSRTEGAWRPPSFFYHNREAPGVSPTQSLSISAANSGGLTVNFDLVNNQNSLLFRQAVWIGVATFQRAAQALWTVREPVFLQVECINNPTLGGRVMPLSPVGIAAAGRVASADPLKTIYTYVTAALPGMRFDPGHQPSSSPTCAPALMPPPVS